MKQANLGSAQSPDEEANNFGEKDWDDTRKWYSSPCRLVLISCRKYHHFFTTFSWGLVREESSEKRRNRKDGSSYINNCRRLWKVSCMVLTSVSLFALRVTHFFFEKFAKPTYLTMNVVQRVLTAGRAFVTLICWVFSLIHFSRLSFSAAKITSFCFLISTWWLQKKIPANLATNINAFSTQAIKL